MNLKNRTISLLLFSGWFILMIIGYIVELKLHSILFYVFALCYFVSFVGTNIIKVFKDD
jgi:hypothetical protein